MAPGVCVRKWFQLFEHVYGVSTVHEGKINTEAQETFKYRIGLQKLLVVGKFCSSQSYREKGEKEETF